MRLINLTYLLPLSPALGAQSHFPRKGPPMGWMSWERFRCEVDCVTKPDECISERLYKTQADLLVKHGYVAAGYNGIHVDDCWSNQFTNERDEVTHEIVANATRFPSGMKGLGDYLHSLGLHFGLYTDIGNRTCGNYVGSFNYEEIDAQSFARWGVDYIKVDGCYARQWVYNERYKVLGDAMNRTGRPITYSCSWPAYLGNDESKKPFDKFVEAGCDTWRNWADIQNDFRSVTAIINHWATYNKTLTGFTKGYHDPDMILAGSDHSGHMMSLDQARIQLSVWSIVAAPLILSNNLATVPEEYRWIIQNRAMIAIDQSRFPPGGVLFRNKDAHVWGRVVEDGVAIALVVLSADKGKVAKFTINWAIYGPDVGHHGIVNIWTSQKVPEYQEDFEVKGQGVLFLKALFKTPRRRVGGGGEPDDIDITSVIPTVKVEEQTATDEKPVAGDILSVSKTDRVEEEEVLA